MWQDTDALIFLALLMKRVAMKKVLLGSYSFLLLSCYALASSNENLSYVSTEKSHPATTLLSNVMHKDCIQGLRLLHQIDTQVIMGLQNFVDNHLENLTKLVDKTRASHGRCFLIGSGSSGRIALDIAARGSKNIIGIIAGGDSAFIRAREGFEDSEDAGQLAMQDYNITARDLVIVISASGSASFNIGCAKQARNVGAPVCYFYNSTQVPAKTQNLFEKQGVIPVCVDIGAQAITGSTRLQAATLARLALGCLLIEEQPQTIVAGLIAINNTINERLPDIVRIVGLEHAVFADPQANFRKNKDVAQQGYVTFIGDNTVIRDIVMDTVESAPTFSINPPRMPHESGKKRAEFQAYLAGIHDNVQAWQILTGRPLKQQDRELSLPFNITEEALPMRPLGPGNMLIGVAWEDPEPLRASLLLAQRQGAKTALILLSEHQITDQIIPECDAVLILDRLPHDATRLIASVGLKQILNMISNGSMILMNKVDGNQMIDVNAANNKLIDRAVRLAHNILTRYNSTAHYEYATIETCIHSVLKHKKLYEERDIYTPSPVKIAVTMLYRDLNFDEAIIILENHQENLERICS